MNTRVTAKMMPGQNGTKRFVRKYGNRLVCVRYRKDKAAGKRLTTIELIVDEARFFPQSSIAEDDYLLVQIGYDETALRHQVKASGGKWQPEEKAWRIHRNAVEQLGLQPRILNNQVE